MRRSDPELRLAFATQESLADIQLLRQVDGDGYLIERPDQVQQDLSACAEFRLAHLRQTRPPGTTMSRTLATVRFRQDTIAGQMLGVFDQAVVRYTQRNLHLAALTAAPALARRFVIDCRPLLALSAVTSTRNKAVVALLTRLGAVKIRPEIASRIHPVLGLRQRNIARLAAAQFAPGYEVIHWGFTAEAIRYLLMLAFEATSEDGHAVETESGTIIARIDGDLEDSQSRQLIYRMATNKIALPVDITDFD